MDQEKLDRIINQKKQWEEESKRLDVRSEPCETVSGRPIGALYTPLDTGSLDYEKDLGFPGSYPYTRGVQTNMYRGRIWTMRQFSGFGDASDSNRRYRYLLEQGQTGLSVAFDLPTIMGYDSDSERSLGEVGRCGVAIDSLEDMEVLFDRIPVDRVTTSMTINGPAAVLWCMYLANAEKQGIGLDQVGGTIQNDILKEYIAQKSWIFPPEPSMRLITDIFAFAADHVPRWNTISISGYHIREAGSTAAQELAFTLADGFAYVEAGVNAGLDIDRFAPRLSFFFNAHIDFFEEICKYRAARRIWARRMKERYGAKDERSLKMRFHTQTAGCSLTAQEPENNIVRTTIEALSAVLGGTQSLHTNSMDEVLALPTEKAVKIALRTQQVIAYESGAANTIDPLAGSYFIEALTDQLESEAEEYFRRIDELGGVLAAIDNGFFQQEIADAAYEYQRAVDQGRQVVVGVNRYNTGEAVQIDLLEIDPDVEEKQVGRLKKLKEKRDGDAVKRSLEELKKGARGNDNLIPKILEAVKLYATEGEIISALKEEFGEYREKPLF